VKPADGSGAEETLVSGESLIVVPTSWSSDGKFLAYWTVGSATGRDIWIAPLTGERKPKPFLQTKFNEMQARFSPDDRWIAYMSEESGRYEVYVQPFPGPGGKWQISTNGGTVPVWAQNGRELFYMSSGKLMSVGVTTQPTLSASTPRARLLHESSRTTPISDGSVDQRSLRREPRRSAIPFCQGQCGEWPSRRKCTLY
jgi:Tol biopolymer transport system component